MEISCLPSQEYKGKGMGEREWGELTRRLCWQMSAVDLTAPSSTSGSPEELMARVKCSESLGRCVAWGMPAAAVHN